MPTVNNLNQCATCKKDNAISRCVGCLEDFCLTHLIEHRQQLGKQLDQIEQDRNLFQQTLNQQTTNPLQHSLVQQIDQWAQESIEKIKQTAQENREIVLVHINKNLLSTKEKLNQLTQQLKHCREEDIVIENRLKEWKEELREIAEQMNKPSNIFIRQTQLPLINRIRVLSPGKIFFLS